APSLHAAEPARSAARLAGLIDQLGSPKPDERDAATLALQTLGPAAMKALRDARQHSDAEVRRRARLLLQDLEPRAQADRSFQPTRVQLTYRDIPVSLAVADLARQTGFVVSLEGDKLSRKVT